MPKVIPTLEGLLRASINECMTKLSASAALAVRPIYVDSDYEGLKHIGSCTLINVGGSTTLWTAAHIIDSHNRGSFLYFGNDNRLEPIEGDLQITTAPNGRSKDRLDFAVWKLPPEKASKLESSAQFSESQLSSTQTTNGYYYAAFGFPYSKNKKIDHPNRNAVASRYAYYGNAIFDVSLETKLNVSRKTHALLYFNKKYSKDLNNKLINSISPVGMSGGAILEIGNFKSDSVLKDGANCYFALVGLITEFHSQPGILVATRFQPAIQALRERGYF